MGRKKIYQKDLGYDILKPIIDCTVKNSYRRISVKGVDNIPDDGAVILAPNHCNTLMDALVVLRADRRAKVFGARADMFNIKLVAKIMYFLRILPMVRLRDGLRNVLKNKDTEEIIIETLEHKVPFCIFPEGQHQAKHSAQPLSKGIFRIAMQAQELMPDMPLYIVPVGLQYGNFFRFRSTINVKIGDPINVGEFLADNSEYTPQEQMNKMRNVLAEKMRSLILYIPNDDNYDAVYEICAASMRPQRKKLLNSLPKGSIHPKLAQFEANNITNSTVTRLLEKEPEKGAELIRLGNEASRMRVSQKISLSSITSKFPLWVRFFRFLLFLITLPYCIPASILILPINLLCSQAFRLLKDYAFRNSVRFMANLIVWPLLLIIYTSLAYIFLPWEWALVCSLLFIPAPVAAQEMWRLFRLEISDIKLLLDKKLRNTYKQIQEIILNS